MSAAQEPSGAAVPSSIFAQIKSGKLKAEDMFAEGGIDATLAKIAEQARGTKRDVTTPKGREAVASLAYSIASTKGSIEKMGLKLTEGWRTQTARVNGEKAKAKTFLDELKIEIRQPLTDFETREDARIAAHKAALAGIEENPEFYGQGASAIEDLERRLAYLQAYPERDWQEFADQAGAVLADEIALCERALDREREHKAAAEEAARLAAEAAEAARLEAERRRIAREEEIARQAAEEARIAAEKAAAEAARIEAARVEAERLAAERAEQERAEAAAKALRDAEEQAEHARQAAAQREADLKRQAEEAEALRQRQSQEAEARAQKAARDAEIAAEESKRLADAAAERARQEERQRIEDEAARVRTEAEAREKDKAHRAKVNGAILAAVVPVIDRDLTVEEIGKAFVIALAKGQIPHVKVAY